MQGKTVATQPGRRTRRGAPPAPALNREVIIAAALGIIDEDGLDAFSLRALAQKLGVYPTAVYWYVPNRNEMMAGIVAHILGKVSVKSRRREWQQSLRDLFDNFRAAVAAHPNAAPLIGTAVVSNTAMDFGFVEHVLSILSRAGLSGADLVAGYNSIIATLVGFSAQEYASMPKEDPMAWQVIVQKRLLELDQNAFPILAANLRLLSNKAFILRWQNGVEAPLESSYLTYITIVIDGIDALAKRSAK
ncbi:TetR/AcrR family transcriptional regulator C-terminal domain-containing protein [Sphingomonas montana]|uniref:TetR/AcrR family transcriptional regulator C-terminal domain-containing protein n=1 Tax=Sphingomonas montana TaxID=1843236 RepID=UPI00096CD211|nr:TetR/AcrR family transcriptional regulator C-terminal domain-containing protein [Sphingomonas montana]